MKSVFSRSAVFAVLLSSFAVSAFGQIWTENFNAYPNGTTISPGMWDSYATDCDDAGPNTGLGSSTFGVYNGQFTVNDVEGAPCCNGGIDGGGNDNAWTTDIIDISGYCDVDISLDVTQDGNMECDSPGAPIFGCTGMTPPDNSQDQLVAEYQVDGGGWIQFGYACGANGIGAMTAAGINGIDLRIRVFAATKANSEYYYFDNVVVNGSLGSTPTFTQIGPLCETDPPAGLLNVSNEGITGTWDVGSAFNPNGQGGTTTTITFNPNPGQCASSTTMDITVNSEVAPTPPALGPFCENDPPVALPTNIGGVTGNWSGAGVSGNMFDPGANTGTIFITFTPDPGQCALTTNVGITVNSETATILPALGPFCQNDPPVALPTNIGGVTGNWSAAFGNTSIVSGNMFFPNSCVPMSACTPTITFTPDPGQCALPADVTITVYPVSIAPFTFTVTYCENDPIVNLPTNIYGIMGNWSGPGVSGNTFDPGASGTGTFPLTYTFVDPVAAQCLGQPGFESSMTVNTEVTPTLGTTTLCETDPPFDLTNIQDPAFPTGIWSGPGVAGNNFNPAGQTGPVNLTFTSDQACTNPAMTTITVEQVVMPNLSTGSTCQNSGPFDLTTLLDPAFPTGTWSGPGVSGNNFDPSGQLGPVTVTFTPAGNCATPAQTTITVDLPGTPTLGSANICQTQGIYDLTLLQDPAFPTGVWTGTGVTTSPTFDPTGLVGNITLTFAPAGGCAFAATTTVTVDLPASPNLGTATVCESAPPFDLTTLQDPANPGGTWSGPGVIGTAFLPTGLNGPIDLTYTPIGNCVFPAMTTITVEETGIPMLGTATICQTSGIFNLTNLNDPAFPAGTWSGPGVTGNNFDPSGQSGNVMLTFTPTANCALPSATTITVDVPTAPMLGSASICESANSFDLTTLEDPAFPAGTWSGPGVTGTTFDPAGQSGTVNVTFTPDTDCSLPAQTTISLNEAPTFSNLTDDCDPVTQTYTISFDINGGSPPYTVNGAPVTGNSFTSTAIPSGSPYSFDLDDANDCGPINISGSVNCTCVTDAGTMDFTGSPLMICHNDDIPINYAGGQILDPDDLLMFVLHDAAGTTLGTILATADPSATSFPNPGLTIGQTYYVSAIAGSDDGTGNIDLNDPCLSVAQGVPVEIYEPQLDISGPPEICEEACATLTITASSGISPYGVSYEIYHNATLLTIGMSNITGTDVLLICPSDFGVTSGTIDIDITAFEDDQGCESTTLPSFSFEVLPAANTEVSPTLCPGENVVINGTEYNQTNPTGQEIITNGAANGCDSIIDVSLSFFPADTNFINQTLCVGSSIEVNGMTYDASTPSGIEILPAANINGCDSIISVDLSFNSEVTFNLEPTLCPGDSVVVNGTVFNASNPNGSETFPMGSYLGCDSTVIVALDFYPTASSNVNPELCEGGSTTINGTVYDEDNPTGQEILPGASVNGCDSILNISLIFTTGVFENFTPTLCPGESVNINGTIYDESNPNGEETFPMGSVQGCDSTVIIGLNFYEIDTVTLNPTLCPGGTLTVNGTVYSELNPSGFEVLPMANVNGCDSVIFVDLIFSSSVESDLDTVLCPGESIMVNGNIYDESMPVGSETFPMGSYLGCDSTVIISLSFFPMDTNFITQNLCSGASLEVNGTTYDEANPSGIEIVAGANVNGCDSVISVSLTFNSTVFGNLDSTLCAGENVVVNGTVYDESNPSGTEDFPMGSYLGCDSTVVINLTFSPPAVGTFDPTLCPGTTVDINGTIYSEGNPTGMEILVGASQFGCDSTVMVDLSFSAPVVTDYTATFCSGGSVEINGTVYDESNPTGVEILQNAAQNGCDSTVNVSLTFDAAVTSDLDTVLCAGGQLFVNGTLYFLGNPTGTETIVGGSYLGCDSIINVNLGFFPEAVLTIDTMLNSGETLGVNGTTYSQSNPTGVEMIPGGSSNGCDSTIIVNITFEGSFGVVTSVFSPTCPMDDDGAIRLDSIIGGELPFLVSLNGGAEEEVFLFPLLFEDLNAGFYSLTIRDAFGVIVTENLIVDNPPEPILELGPDQTVRLGDEITLSPTTDFPPIDLTWAPPTYLDCTDCLTVESTPSDDIAYTLTATTPEGCVVSDGISILVTKERRVFAPDAFSPNNDAINDEFTLFAGPEVAKINRLLIYNRWGDNVFEQYNFQPNNLAIGWDGTYNGEELNPAVFVWFAEVEFLDGEVVMFEGGVTLIR